MRHIKIFEEYSDEEINDLIGDLEGIGHKGKLTQGEDFGFGTSLKEENDGGWFFTVSDEAVKILQKKGILKPDFNTIMKREEKKFSNPQEWFSKPTEWMVGTKHYFKEYLPSKGRYSQSEEAPVWRLNLPGVPSPKGIKILEKIAEKLRKIII